MSIVQWLLLILVIAVVGGAYWYMRHQAGNDPWQGMDDDVPDDELPDRGESLGGDSYIVGVRTLTSGESGPRKNGTDPDEDYQRLDDASAEASWSAYKKRSAESGDEGVTPPAAEPERGQARPRPGQAVEKPSDALRVKNMRPQSAPPGGEQEVFVLHVTAVGDRLFDGPDVHAALETQGLKFGLNDVFHRVTEAHGVPESVFAVANMLKPGTLDPDDQDHLQTPGLVLFMVVPGPVDGVPAMRDMMETANGLAQALGGQVLDDKRALLNAQTAQFMLDQIADIDRRAKIAQRR